jgi:hypothetical protein
MNEILRVGQRVNDTDRVEWKPCHCRLLHFPFNIRKDKSTLGNTLVLALVQEE